MPSDLVIRLRQNFGFLTAIVLFCVSLSSSINSHIRSGFSSAVLVQNGDEVFALAMRGHGPDRAGADGRP